MSSTVRRIFVLFIVCAAASCNVGQAQLNVRQPIERANGYRQRDILLARDDMVHKIRKIESCSGPASGAEVLPYVATGFGALSGSLLGYPLGYRAVNSDGIGDAEVGLYVAGSISLVLGIIVEIVAVGLLSKAVDCYNERFERGEVPPRRPRRSPPPDPILVPVQSNTSTTTHTSSTSAEPPEPVKKAPRKAFRVDPND